MKQQKAVFLFLALILPVCIFLFLKFFGKNEFAVTPLYVDVPPASREGCQPIRAIPYHIPDSIKVQLPFDNDSLVVVYVGELTNESSNQLNRIDTEFKQFPVGVLQLPDDDKARYWKNCIFFLYNPFDLVLLDSKGMIRGQYESASREEMDRLLTELSIILKQY